MQPSFCQQNLIIVVCFILKSYDILLAICAYSGMIFGSQELVVATGTRTFLCTIVGAPSFLQVDVPPWASNLPNLRDARWSDLSLPDNSAHTPTANHTTTPQFCVTCARPRLSNPAHTPLADPFQLPSPHTPTDNHTTASHIAPTSKLRRSALASLRYSGFDVAPSLWP